MQSSEEVNDFDFLPNDDDVMLSNIEKKGFHYEGR